MAINQSNLPTIQRFKYEDFPGAPQWFSQFLSSLNLFAPQVYQILNGGVNYGNLTIPQLYSTTITAPASGNTTFTFVNPLKISPSCVVIGNIYVFGTPSVHPTNATSVYWHYSQNSILVDNIPNLTPGTQYAVTLQIS